jgi:hypothetical protein
MVLPKIVNAIGSSIESNLFVAVSFPGMETFSVEKLSRT